MQGTRMFLFGSLLLGCIVVGVLDHQQHEKEHRALLVFMQDERERYGVTVGNFDADVAALAVRVDQLEVSPPPASVESVAALAADARNLTDRVRSCEAAFLANTVTSARANEQRNAEMEELRNIINDAMSRVTAIAQQVHGAEGRLDSVVAASQKVDVLYTAVDRMQHEQQSAKPRLDTSAKYQKLLGPAVQVVCDREVGSGTVVASISLTDDTYTVYVLTALHVVQSALDKKEAAIGVTSFVAGVEVMREATLIAYKASADLAMLAMQSAEQYPYIARLAPRASLSSIQIFEKVYAVGCPLGYAPLQTSGELTMKRKVLAGVTYWMTNAPTIFGNSGGGIFLADTGELIGVLSRVSAYNNFVNIAVPHMGIFVPPDEIYTWLDEERMQFVYDPSAAETAKEAVPAKEGMEEHVPPLIEGGAVRPTLK